MANKTVCVVGLGYVGLPLAVAMAKKYNVLGYDVDKRKVEELSKNIDLAGEVTKEELANAKIGFGTEAGVISKADFVIVAVPTPINDARMPDLSFIQESSKTVGRNLQRGATVVYESTVYPGVTEEVCIPILEKESQMKCGTDFYVGYSPERINPGDKEHTVEKILKIVSGYDEMSLQKVVELYQPIIKGGLYKASSLKVAEAAKVIENTQRDLNIALVNELSLIFERMKINTREVIEAAGTKWNFHKYYPGLVGGHCISVDPHYLLYKAQTLGYNPKVILAGREVNDFMPVHVAEITIKALIEANKPVKNCKILILGLTFKENVSDTRNTKASDIIKELKSYDVQIFAHDPLLERTDIENKFKVKYHDINTKGSFDAIIITVLHNQYERLDLENLKNLTTSEAVLIDVKSKYKEKEARTKGFSYRCL